MKKKLEQKLEQNNKKKIILKKYNNYFTLYYVNNSKLTSLQIKLESTDQFCFKKNEIKYLTEYENNFPQNEVNRLNKYINTALKENTENKSINDNKLFIKEIERIKLRYLNNKQYGTYKRMNVIELFLKINSKDKLNINKIEHKHIQNFYLNCLESNNKNSSIHSKLKMLKTILLQIDGVNQQKIINIFKTIKIKINEPKIRYLNEKELFKLEQLFESYSESNENKEVLRLFLFSVYTGLRFRDVVQLKKEDLDLDDRILHITTSKNKKQLILPLSNSSVNILNKKTNSIFTFNILKNKYLILSELELFKKIESLNIYVNRKLKQIAIEAEISKKLTFHFSRHTCATILLNNGADLMTISQILNHSSIKETQVYLKVNTASKQKTLSIFDNLKNNENS